MKILITRPRSQPGALAAQLRSLGLEPVNFPVIEIRPLADLTILDQALRSLSHYAWVIFTSANAVDIFFDRLPGHLLASFSPHPSADAHAVRVAAIGPKTAAALRSHGVEPAFVPAEAVAEAILPGLGAVIGARLLLPQAEIARPTLAEAITQAGGIVDAIAIYQTLPADPGPDALAALVYGVDAVTFTSPSTVKNFVAIVQRAGLDPVRLPGNPFFICIGPVTQQAAAAAGLTKLTMAAEHTAEGLVHAIVNFV